MSVHLQPFRLLPLLLSSALLLPACAPSGDNPPEVTGYTVRDSAGVSIVENTEPAWGEGEKWSVTPEPLLSIGEVDGPDEYILYHALNPIRLPDGTIVVGNNGSQELRFYDGEGRFITRTGSAGEGPGEFRTVFRIWRLGPDSLAVVDLQLHRISVFGLDGTFARVFRLGEGSGDILFPEGMFGDGTILVSKSLGDVGDFSELGPVRDRYEYRRYGREGELLSPLPTLPGSELYRGVGADGSGFTTDPEHGIMVRVVAATDRWFYCGGDRFEIQERNPEGALIRIFRLDRERRATPQEVFDDWEERLQRMRPQARQVWGSVPVSEMLPTYEQLLVDRRGNVWMAEYRVLEEAHVWQVFDPEGHWLGSVTLPDGGRISEIGEDYVLGVWRDEMDVETVRMYGLIKP